MKLRLKKADARLLMQALDALPTTISGEDHARCDAIQTRLVNRYPELTAHTFVETTDHRATTKKPRARKTATK